LLARESTPIRCSDAEIGPAKQLQGYSVWLLENGLAVAHDKPIPMP